MYINLANVKRKCKIHLITEKAFVVFTLRQLVLFITISKVFVEYFKLYN